jgi:hypothetical protein
MSKLFFLIIMLFMFGCSANEALISDSKPKFESMSFDVVQKKLVIEQDIPIDLQKLITKWFNSKIKIDGFDGDMIFTISNYSEGISSINNGKKIDASMSFQVLIKKPSLSKKKLIEGTVTSYGTLTGNFSLSDFDKVITNTQNDLILRLTRDLKNKI